jgi:hypothetical protein
VQTVRSGDWGMMAAGGIDPLGRGASHTQAEEGLQCAGVCSSAFERLTRRS